jgi:peptidoglycan/xylan/chitin deacetylase (PgdA/CDA1 family)
MTPLAKLKINTLKIFNRATFSSSFRNNMFPAILMYHGITNDRSLSKQFWTQVHEDNFIEQMEYLKRHYNPISLTELVAGAEEKRVFKSRITVVTFDDGYENNYLVAKPILERLGIPATFFCVSEFVGGDNPLWSDLVRIYVNGASRCNDKAAVVLTRINNLLSEYGPADYNNLIEILKMVPVHLKNQVVSMLENGTEIGKSEREINLLRGMRPYQVKELAKSDLFEIGAHSVSHEILTQCSKEEAKRQITESITRLSQITESEIALFAYPDGDYNADMEAFVRQAGCKAAVTTEAAFVTNDKGPYSLPRIGIGSGIESDFEYFKVSLRGLFCGGSLNPYKIIMEITKNVMSR